MAETEQNVPNDDLISRKMAYETLTEYYHIRTEIQHKALKEALERVPPAQPEWNNHTVACLLADLFGDSCACYFNDIADWLSEKCDLSNNECPYPVGVACWEQFLKHRKGEQDE